jgi:hypothetical protein
VPWYFTFTAIVRTNNSSRCHGLVPWYFTFSFEADEDFRIQKVSVSFSRDEIFDGVRCLAPQVLSSERETPRREAVAC